ncbi:ligand-binding sensor domain-containing diguanylate cyclase [Marinicella meishanensis]|uniref:ligand-binding sensor domain-containing diguanylate cyclase n=1 Tax=Marinicella meishanensis TaxID=2873263 RepID=UPI001CC108B5|nr:ligand-binding sensor domain-containing diguanylate cyclase [Marinicella sp. NBU2979]
MWLLLCWCLTPQAQQLPFAELSIADGLEDMVVFDIEQDNLGFLWITTRTGVNRFDGTRFNTYKQVHGLPHNLVRDLMKDPRGRLWAGSEAGLAWFDGKQFIPVLQDQWPNHVSIRAVKAGRDDTLWVATYGMGVLHIDVRSAEPRILTQYNTEHDFPSDRIRSLLVAQDGTVWAGDSRRVYRIDGADHQVIEWHAEPSEIRYLYQHQDLSIWAGTRQGVVAFDGTAFVPKTFDVDLSQLTINDIKADINGHVWVSTRDFGAYQFNAQNQLLQHLNMDNGLPDNSVNSVYHDTEENLWLGTYGGGLARLSTTDVINWKAQAAMPNPNVYVITNDQRGCLWVGTNGDGVTAFCADGLRHITTADGLSHNKVLSGVVDADGNPWFGTLQGLSYLQDGAFINMDDTQGLTGSVVYHMTLAADGSIWIATNNGLNHYQNGQFTAYFEADGLPDNRINMVIESQAGGLWLGTSNGLSRFVDGQFTNWTNDDGLGANFINDLYEDDRGQLWLATNDGLSLFDGQTFRTWTTADGLPHDNTTTLLPGDGGDIWVGTSRGVAIFDGQTFTVITSREGLVFDLVNRSAGYKDQAGNLWFGTGEGISRFGPDFAPGSTTPPPVHILDVFHEADKLETGQNHQLTEADSSLSFSFTAISFQRAPDINYRYRLKKSEQTPWRNTRLNELQVDALAPGKYQFQVTARIGNGNWNTDVASFDFEITPPFWKQPWFMLLGVLLFLFAWFYRSWRNKQHALQLEAIVQQRTKQLKKMNEGLDWLAHHDSLTKLANRHHIKEVLSAMTDVNSTLPCGVLVIDLDHFKTINDNHGHGVGDQALQLFSECLQDLLEDDQTAARWGGEEFIVLSPGTNLVKMKKLAHDVLEQCAQLTIPTDTGEILKLTCSVGFVYCVKATTQTRLTRLLENSIQLADKALYVAKHTGRNQACGYLINHAIDESILKGYIAQTEQAIADKHIVVSQF